MTREELTAIFADELTKIAPDASLDGVDDTADLRDALDLDSMDISNLIIGLHARLGVDIPDKDAVQMTTLKGAIDYLAARL